MISIGTCAIGSCENDGVKQFREDAPVSRAWHLCQTHWDALRAAPEWPRDGGDPEALQAFLAWLPRAARGR